MLRIKAEERLSANDCLTRGYDLGLFDRYVIESGTATPTQRTVQEAEIGSIDGSTTILAGALWGTDDLEPPPNHLSSALGCSRFIDVAPEVAQDELSKTSADPVPSLSETQSSHIPNYKRQRSSADSSIKHSSGSTRIKRRQADLNRKMKSVSHIYSVAQQVLDQVANRRILTKCTMQFSHCW